MDRQYKTSKTALHSRAQAVAKRYGLVARKPPRRTRSASNLGGYAIIDPILEIVLYGRRFDLTAQQVIEIIESNET
jgi:hypothetical protein